MIRDSEAISSLLSTDPNTLVQYNQDSVYKGSPEYAYSAGDWQEVSEVLAYCHSKKLPVTFCGSQTSMTGSSVANEGLALSLSKKNKIIDIGEDKNGELFLVTEPGVILGDLKQAARDHGYLYPPDPTSYKEVQIGSTVATNATGEETFRYGPTRRYVQELEIILPDGSLRTLKRQKEVPHSVIKNAAGYYLGGEEIDEVIGSEGTLCLIKEIKLKLLKVQKDKTFVLVLPFSKLDTCIQAVPLLANNAQGLRPKAIELIGPGAAECFKKCPACPKELMNEKCFLYIKDEYLDESEFEIAVELWFDHLKKIYDEVGEERCLDRVFLAKTDKQLSDFHECRHFIPSLINEKYFDFSGEGGGKVGTDWWVPLQHLHEMMMTTYREAQGLEMPFIVFAHIGNGHPHWNFLARNADEKKIAIDFVKRQCQAAVGFGGGVAGEHGIGKIKRYYMEIQHASDVMKKMVALKEKWDPLWMLGRGNILEFRPKGPTENSRGCQAPVRVSGPG